MRFKSSFSSFQYHLVAKLNNKKQNKKWDRVSKINYKEKGSLRASDIKPKQYLDERCPLSGHWRRYKRFASIFALVTKVAKIFCTRGSQLRPAATQRHPRAVKKYSTLEFEKFKVENYLFKRD